MTWSGCDAVPVKTSVPIPTSPVEWTTTLLIKVVDIPTPSKVPEVDVT